MITDIPSARTVDYCDADEICGYQMLLCKMFEKAGGLGTGRVSDKEIAAIRREGMSWLKEVRGHIDDLFSSTVTPDKEKSRLALGDLPRILGSYDFFYRICHGAPCFGYLTVILTSPRTIFISTCMLMKVSISRLFSKECVKIGKYPILTKKS